MCPCFSLSFLFRISDPSPADMAATAGNLRTPPNLSLRSQSNPHTYSSPRRLPSPLTWITDTPDPTTATATDTGTELGTLSTTTQRDFILTMAAMETDLCQARWEALASAPHIGEVIKVCAANCSRIIQIRVLRNESVSLQTQFCEKNTQGNSSVTQASTLKLVTRWDFMLRYMHGVF